MKAEEKIQIKRNRVMPSPALWARRAVCPPNSCLPQGAVSNPTPMQRVPDNSDGQDSTAINSPTVLEVVVFGPGRSGICPTLTPSLETHHGALGGAEQRQHPRLQVKEMSSEGSSTGLGGLPPT